MIKYGQLSGVKVFKSTKEALQHISDELVKSHDALNMKVKGDLKYAKETLKHTPAGSKANKGAKK